MVADNQHIVGSAEPLSSKQTEVRLRELEEWGVDLSLAWASLQQSPQERLDHTLNILAFTQALRHAWQTQGFYKLPVVTQADDQVAATSYLDELIMGGNG